MNQKDKEKPITLENENKETKVLFSMIGRDIPIKKEYEEHYVNGLQIINKISTKQFNILMELIKINAAQIDCKLSNLDFLEYKCCNVVDFNNLPEFVYTEEPKEEVLTELKTNLKSFVNNKILIQVKNRKPIYMINPFLIIPPKKYLDDTLKYWDYLSLKRRTK